MGCLFCDIVQRKVQASIVYENDRIIAFEDISPKAPVHVLVIHKTHIRCIEELNAENSFIMADLFLGVREVAAIKGIDKNGYRVIINNGPSGGQIIWHLHVHVLGGRERMGRMVSDS